MEYNGYGYEPKRKKSGVGSAVLIAVTTMAVVIGLFAGVILMNSTVQKDRTAAAELPAASDALPTAAVENTQTEAPTLETAAAPVGTSGFAYDGQYTRAQVVELAAPSVVGIDGIFETTVSYWGRAQTYEQQGSGSGVILTEDGYIATCAHVVDGAKSLTVTLNDDTSYEATIVGTDSRNDLAIIKIDAIGLVPATLGDSDMLTVGEDVIAIGNPLGELRGTATSGIISAARSRWKGPKWSLCRRTRRSARAIRAAACSMRRAD